MKRLLGIMAVASVFAFCLVLAGCGGGGAQGSDGSNNQQGIADTQEAPNGEQMEANDIPAPQTAEPIADTPTGVSGPYVYTVSGVDLPCSINVQDYIRPGKKYGYVWDFARMANDLGFTVWPRPVDLQSQPNT